MDLEDLINDHNEGNYLDFKKEDYPRDKKYELLKDIIAFANSEHIGDRFIIIGVNEKKEPREFFDIENPMDSASLQQFVSSNINPELDIDIFPYIHEGHNLAVIQIKNPVDKPYEVKKSFAYKTDKGDKVFDEGAMFIRVGSRTKPMSRKYLDNIYDKKFKHVDGFVGKLAVVFKNTKSSTIDLPHTELSKLPSEIEKLKLETLILYSEKLEEQNPKDFLEMMGSMITVEGISIGRLEPRFELLKKIQQVKKRFKKYDDYFLHETNAQKIQLVIENLANKPLENCTILVRFPKINGITIVKEIVSNPDNDYTTNLFNSREIQYPDVVYTSESIGISKEIGNIKHRMPTKAFITPIRASFAESLIEQTIPIEVILFADNLEEPQSFNLEIKVV